MQHTGVKYNFYGLCGQSIPQGVCLHASQMPQKKERIVRGVEAAHKTNELRIKGRKGKSGLAGEKQVLYNKIESQR